ncbi:MAG: HAMP domain-containing histidine kinase [Deltaproteobacteria bacterium]|jgi:signal transduction histidine kinase|nr:HAMP domain-containing histidine kinase [Deltaproteobacteria bacterium]MDA8305279.1 HAMP domain-containing sensor histidine kinase [Deltaproteobacteria bacterium]
MASAEASKSKKISEEQYIGALYEKDRLNYSGKFVQGFVHNANGPLHNISMLAEMLLSGLEVQDRIFQSLSGENQEWSALLEKQRKRLTQMCEQISNLVSDLREFMQLYEIEQHGTEIDINALLTRMVQLFRADLFFKHYVNCELRLEKNLPHIKVPGKDMVSAVFHLFENGVTALRNSAKRDLVVETSMQYGQITVRITDSGPGPPEGVDPDIVFELFESRWRKSDNKNGPDDRHLGFGLYAARQLLSPHGFEVSLEKTGEGTSALIRVPLKRKSA